MGVMLMEGGCSFLGYSFLIYLSKVIAGGFDYGLIELCSAWFCWLLMDIPGFMKS